MVEVPEEAESELESLSSSLDESPTVDLPPPRIMDLPPPRSRPPPELDPPLPPIRPPPPEPLSSSSPPPALERDFEALSEDENACELRTGTPSPVRPSCRRRVVCVAAAAFLPPQVRHTNPAPRRWRVAMNMLLELDVQGVPMKRSGGCCAASGAGRGPEPGGR